MFDQNLRLAARNGYLLDYSNRRYGSGLPPELHDCVHLLAQRGAFESDAQFHLALADLVQ
jgi:hypothetical protein